MTMTYVLYRDEVADPACDVLLVRSRHLHAALRQAVADPNFCPNGATLGFNCTHVYEESELGQADRKLGGGARPDVMALKLKNEDAVIAVAAANLGLVVETLRLVEVRGRRPPAASCRQKCGPVAAGVDAPPSAG